MTATRPGVAFRIATALLIVVAGAAPAEVDTGFADFSTFVAVGDSLFAGFTSGGLTASFQRDSMPALIHRQAVGEGTFEQPLVSAPGIPPLLELVSLSPVLIDRLPGLGEPLNLDLPRPYDNLAVPGARARDTLARVTDIEEEGNPPGMHDLILRGLGTALEQAVSLEPTFVALWIGANDILPAVLSGTVVDGVTMTPVEEFREDYELISEELRAATEETRLVMATIPDVTRIPFATTIPPYIVDPATGEPVLIGGERVFLLGPDGALSDDDLVLLTAGPLLTGGVGIPAALGGTGEPLPAQVILTLEEVELILERLDELNQVIRDTAFRDGAALVEVRLVFDEIASQGLSLGGIQLTTEFLLGGIFSYDAVHPTRFGYAFVANLFIEEINRRFAARIPVLDLSPFLFGELGDMGAVSHQAVPTARISAGGLESLFDALRVPEVEASAPGPPPPPATELPAPRSPEIRGRGALPH